MYGEDLAFIHDAGFGAYARRAAPEVVRILARHGLRRGMVVEFGCGGGVLARRLHAAGYRVLGIDLSPAMIRIARVRAAGATFRVGTLGTAAIPRCQAVVAIGEVVSYATRADLRRFVRCAYRVLEPGGVLIFDFICSPAGRAFREKRRMGRGWSISLSAKADRANRVLTRRITTVRRVNRGLRRGRETHRVRIYSRDEMRTLLRRNGFEERMHRTVGRVRLIRSDLLVVARKP